MRLDCPKCGAKGDSRLTKAPRWRCSPAPSNGGCGYEWDDPTYNDPGIDYRLNEEEVKRLEERAKGDRLPQSICPRCRASDFYVFRKIGTATWHCTKCDYAWSAFSPPKHRPAFPPSAPEPTPNADSDGPKENYWNWVAGAAPGILIFGQLSFLLFIRLTPALVATLTEGCRNDPQTVTGKICIDKIKASALTTVLLLAISGCDDRSPLV